MRMARVIGAFAWTLACSGPLGGDDPDAGPAADCETCGEDEICVVHCGGFGSIFRAECVESQCASACTEECEEELCDTGFLCQYGCNDTPDGAFACAGP